MSMSRIGLFGGTFDPIHNGHVHIARAFADELALDTVVFIPAGEPYHRDAPARTAAAQRLAMVELAIAEEPRFAVSDCDVLRKGATYTFDTVQIFRQAFAQAQLWWLLGMDSLLNIHTWHRYQALLDSVNIAVAARGRDSLSQLNPALHAWLPQALAKAQTHPDGCDGGRLHLLQAPLSPLSATAIRQAYAAGQGAQVAADLPPGVAAYIAEHGLYTL